MCIENQIPQPPEENDVDFGIYGNGNEIEYENVMIGRVNLDLLAGRQLQRQIIREHFTN